MITFNVIYVTKDSGYEIKVFIQDSLMYNDETDLF